ncbi:MAG: hypothetical protein AAGF24_15225 [Cyanobacteria bacterium P01_H01_bin.121]
MTDGLDQNEILAQYVQRLSELGQATQTSALPTQADLEAIALELGISAETVQKARQLAHEQLMAGIRHNQQQQWEQALKALQQSLELHPINLDTLHQLALAYQGRYQETRQQRDREQAQQYLKQCLQLQPDWQPAQQLLNELEQQLDQALVSDSGASNLAESNRSPLQPQNRRYLPLVLGGSSLALISGIALFVSFFTVRQSPNSPSVVQVNPIQVEPEAPATAQADAESLATTTSDSASEVQSFTPSTPATGNEQDIPIERGANLTAAGLDLEVRQSRLQKFNPDSFYNLTALLVNNSDQELQKVNLVLELLNASGEVLSRPPLKALDTFHPSLRPGDRYPFATTLRTTASVAQARLTSELVDGLPAANQYDPGTVVPIDWGVEQPAHWQLEARQRSLSVKPMLFKEGSDRANATFAITNTGAAPLQKLKLELRFYDKGQEPLGTESLLIAYGDRPALLPNETRLIRGIEEIGSGFDNYELVVVEAE